MAGVCVFLGIDFSGGKGVLWLIIVCECWKY